MTTGNVNQAAFVINAVSMGNVVAPNANGGSDFKKVMKDASTDNTEVKAVTETRIDNGKVKDSVKKSEVKEAKVEEKDVEPLVEDIKNIIKDALKISDEDFQMAMENLGFLFVDLLEPQNVATLIAEVKDTSIVNIVTDDELSNLMADINSKIVDVCEQFANEQNMGFESVKEAIKQTVIPEDKTDTVVVNEVVQTVDMNVTEVKVESKEKTIEITVEDNRNTSENVVTNETIENTDDSNDKSKNKNNDTKHNDIIQNISEAVANATDRISDIGNVSEPNQVDGIDIVRQIIDSVKVGITEEIQSMEINLNPENLGKINLSIVSKDGIITASITTQNEAVKAAIENQITMLKEQLDNQGIKVQEVEVTVASHGFDFNSGDNERNNENSKSNARKRFRGIDEISDENVATNNDNELADSNINLKA